MAAESDMDTWVKTREAVTHFRKLLLCSKCSNILTEPVCLGICEHLLCRLCASPHAGDGCSVCHSPAWVKDIQINRQLSNITELFRNLESLFCPAEVQAPSAESSKDLIEKPIFSQKKNFKIWLSPKSRKVRCRVEKPVEVNLTTGRSSTKLSESVNKAQDSKLLSVFNFNSSSQDSGSSSPVMAKGRDKKKKRKKKSVRSVSKQASCATLPTRYQTKQKLKMIRLEAVNQQWGFSKKSAMKGESEEEETKILCDNEGKTSKRVSFHCNDSQFESKEPQEALPQSVLSPKRSILKEQTANETIPSSTAHSTQSEQQLNSVMESVVDPQGHVCPCPRRTPKRARKEVPGGSPQTTPKRPRLSPGKRRRKSCPSRAAQSIPPLSPDNSKSISGLERSKEEQKVSPNSSPVRVKSPVTPATGKRLPGERHSQSSPAYMRRNHKGETPLHLAAIKGDVEATRELLTQGADPNLKDHAGWTPLHEACNLGHFGVVEVLLQQGTLLNTPGYENDSPLHDAVRNGHVAVAKLLLEHGASTNVLNIFGLQPVDYAVTQDMKEVLRVGPKAPHPKTLTSPVSLSKIAGITRRDVPMTMIGTKLTQPLQNQLIKAAQVLGGKWVDTFSSAVTHVVVPDGPVPTTLTVLQGILCGCWIVSFSWLAGSQEEGRWLEESDFEAGEGPKRARVNRDNLLPRLFDGCFFYLLGSFRKPPKEELVQLVKAGGGQILARQPKPDSDVTQTVSSAAYHAQLDSDQAFCTQYILYEPEGSYRPSRIRLGKVWSAPSSWLLDCITAFTLLPVPEL